MLSRIAESLYWIGRYLERAEDTARLLDVHLHLGVEDPLADRHQAATLLMSVMGAQSGEATSPGDVMRRLCYDVKSPSSVLAALRGARESARRSRETVPTEMWESINTTWHSVQHGQLSAMRPANAFRWVRERCAVITATADNTMSHDQGWQFLALGRSIERIDMTARLVEAAALTSSSSAWSTALRSTGAHHAFVQSSSDQDSDMQAVAFLLLDRMFPRSLLTTLDTAIDALGVLESGLSRTTFDNEAARLLGQERARLEFRVPGTMLDELPERMTHLQSVCARADAAIAVRYFEGAIAPEWHEGAL